MRALAVAVAAVLLSHPITALGQTAVAVDSASRQIVFLDLAKGTVESKVTIPLATVGQLLVSPDNGTIVALYDGGYRASGFPTVEIHPDKPAAFAVVTRDKLIAAGPLGCGIAGSAFSGDGKYAYVLTRGDDTKKEEDLKPSELVRIDAASGAETGRLTFHRSSVLLGFDPSGTTAVVFSPLQAKRNPPAPARMTFIDMAGWKESGSLDIPGKPQYPVAAGELFYFVDPGEKDSTGKVVVVDRARRTIVKSIAVGSNAHGGRPDRDGNFFVFSQSTDRKTGQVTIIRAGDVVATYGTGAVPQGATRSPDGKRLYILGDQLNVIDLDAKSAGPAVDAAHPVIAVLPTSDGRRLITSAAENQGCCRISVFDTISGKQLTSFLGGSKGTRVGQRLAAAAMSIASYHAGSYSIYAPTFHGAPRGPMTFGPGEKKAYVVDTQTSDITVVDMETGQRIVNIDAGSGLMEVIALPEAGLIAAVSDERIDLIDAKSDIIRESVKMNGGVKYPLMTPDEKRMIVYGKEKIVVLDPATGRQLTVIDALKSPSLLILQK